MKEKVKISQKRLENIKNAFGWVDWMWRSAKIIDPGWGDKPQIQVVGRYRNHWVIFRTQSPGGSEARMYVKVKKGVVSAGVSPLCKSEIVRSVVITIIDTGGKGKRVIEGIE